MKRSLLLILLSFSLVQAQVVTGGGSTKRPELKLQHEIEEYVSQLKSRQKICNLGSPIDDSADLMQTYLKLTLYKSSSKEPAKCGEINQYFMCVNNKDTQKQIKKLKNQKNLAPYLEQTYHLDHSKCEEMLKFFEEMGKTESIEGTGQNAGDL